MNRKFQYIFFFTIILLCFSCTRRETYSHFFELKNAQWSKFDTLYFQIDSSDIVLNTPMKITIELNNNSEYPYQNLWLFVYDDFESQDEMKKNEKQYKLADDMGKWYGSGFGALYQLTLTYKNLIMFSQKRNYQVKMVHGMRDEPLIGIEKVGLGISVLR